MGIQDGNIVALRKPKIDHLDRCGYLLGFPLAHSLSPLLHQTIFRSLGLNWDYLLLPSTDRVRFLDLVRESRCYGAGVTMPNKVAIIPELDGITPEAADVGACNTIFKRGPLLIGTNTDIIGVRESFFQNVSKEIWSGRPGLVIGAGGAARSAVYALVKLMGCRSVYLVNRDATEAEDVMEWCLAHGYGDGLIHVQSCAQAERLEGPGAIVSCVPNFTPTTAAEWEVRRIATYFFEQPCKGAVLEMCYHPTPWTELGALATATGWQVVLGTEAMIYQGLEQARCWTGKDYAQLPVEMVKDAVSKELIGV